jgi:hypothetical protein
VIPPDRFVRLLRVLTEPGIEHTFRHVRAPVMSVGPPSSIVSAWSDGRGRWISLISYVLNQRRRRRHALMMWPMKSEVKP